MSGSSRSGVLKVVGAALTVVVAFALIGAGVQLARNAEGYKVKTAALGEVAGAPVTVLDDESTSASPAPPVLATSDAVTPVAPSGSTPPPTTTGGNPGGGGSGGGGNDDPTPELPPELEPIIGLVGEITGATTDTLGGAGTETLDETTANLGL